ncbi:M24 family metallopeptidase [Rhizobium puerariae]|uniref:M24 family metallopeptidase n=1 Tax=Rhizobium puerariae TaxID=1585791 RepID=A0ABV6AIC8_9HYPH
MTVRLHASLETVLGRLGAEFGEQLTYPGIYRGSRLNVAPVLVEREGVSTVVISEADSDACRVMVPGVGKSVYGRYFDWDKDMAAPVRTFAQAVRDIAGDGTILCEAALPLVRYQALAESGPVELFGMPEPRPLFVYAKKRGEIEAQWLATRDADAAAFAPFVATLRDGARLVDAMTASARGFGPLDALCTEKGFPALYITAPHEVEMFTGLPARAVEQQGMGVLFRPGEAEITIHAEKPILRGDFRHVGTCAGLAQALGNCSHDVIAIQKDHISVGEFASLAQTGIRFEDAAYVIRRWQDRRAGDDAVYFFFAANAVLKGIDAARAFFARNAEGEITERDLVAAYHQGVSRFARHYGFADRVGSYFDIVHSGARTLLPATAGDYPVRVSDRTIKFDMGLTVSDAFGCIRGVSDIARTICAEAEIEALHDRLRNILIDELIPAIRPGMSGAQVHEIGVDLLRPLEAEFRRLGLLPEGKGVDGYLRDCGHTIQRQTISSVYFLPGVGEKVENGMLGCTEYVWPIGDILIAVEDGYLVTPEGGIAFTVEGEG